MDVDPEPEAPPHGPGEPPPDSRRWKVDRAWKVFDAAVAVVNVIGENWYLVAVFLITALLLAKLPQGLEAIFALADRPLLVALKLCAVITAMGVMAALFASLLEDWPTDRDGPGEARQFAAYYAPAVIGLAAAYLVPVFLDLYRASQPGLSQVRDGTIAGLILFIGSGTVAMVMAARGAETERDGQKTPTYVAFIGLTTANLIVYAVTLSSVASLVFLLAGFAVIDAYTWRTENTARSRKARLGIGILFALALAYRGYRLARSPIERGDADGSVTVLMTGISFWLAVGYLVAAVGMYRPIARGRPGVPRGIAVIGALVLVWAFVFSTFGEAPVRRLAGGAPARPKLEEFATLWLEARRPQIEKAESYPVFLVTAKGGGIRAAYWTASTLAALHDDRPDFPEHVFALSGVSGGSVGAAVFSAIVRESRHGALPQIKNAPEGIGPARALSSVVLRHDLLAPPLATMIVSDAARSVAQKLTPARLRSLLPGSWPDDRGVTLEAAFESSWKREIGNDRFSAPFDELWKAGDDRLHVPLLFLNCTQADTAQRLVVSPVSFDEVETPSCDLLSLIGDDRLRLSTAAFLSARFPIISPAAVVTSVRTGVPVKVVDGGYFDNSGAATGSDALTALVRAAKRLGLEKRVRFVALMIANDPDASEPKAVDEPPDPQLGQTAPASVPALVSPVQTLDSARSGFTRRFELEFGKQLKEAGGEALDGFHPHHDAVAFPLGWMLSDDTCQAMEAQIDALRKNEAGPFSRVKALLGPPPR